MRIADHADTKGGALMACLEHECHGCGTLWHSNRTNESCPECGGNDYSTVFDEVPDYDYGDRDEEAWDGRDV